MQGRRRKFFYEADEQERGHPRRPHDPGVSGMSTLIQMLRNRYEFPEWVLATEVGNNGPS